MSQASDVTAEIKRKLEKKEKKRKKRDKKLQELQSNGETNEAEVSACFSMFACMYVFMPACFDLRLDPLVVLSQCATCQMISTPNH